MIIQKPTVLDVARIRAELSAFCGFSIQGAFGDNSRIHLYFILRDSPAILNYTVDKQTAYISTIGSLPPKSEKVLPGIEGFSISEIRQINNDRILYLSLAKKDRLGKIVPAGLVVEMIPNIGDAFFVDPDLKVKSTLKGKKIKSYKYPSPLKKPTILNMDEGLLKSIMEKESDPANEIYGLNHRDLLNLSLSGENDIDGILYDLKEYAAQAVKPGPAWIISSNNEYTGFSLVKPVLTHDETAVEFESALEMYEHYYRAVSAGVEKSGPAGNLSKILKSEIARTEKKISKIETGLDEAERAEIYRQYGEMILVNINNIPRGVDSVTLRPLNSPGAEEISISLNPAKTAAANAKDYFKKSKKAASSMTILEKRLHESKQYLAELRNLNQISAEDVNELEDRMRELGLLAEKKATRKKVEPRKPYRSFHASCGWEILVGKSNKDNDELTFHIASKEDYWFHAWQAAGSHTVLRLPDKSARPDKQTLMEAASLAAWFSKARHSSKVPVACTQVKYVRKPRKFPPGKVLVEREKELMVKPANPDLFAAKGQRNEGKNEDKNT